MAALPCHRVDPELYFAETPADVEIAKANCAPCPVRAECHAGAQDRREPWGVWGGEDTQALPTPSVKAVNTP